MVTQRSLASFFNKYAHTVFEWGITALVVQLTAYLCSTPILLWWGMPLSIMSLAGNLLFTPLMSVFIFLSALITVTQLTAIPNKFLVLALDQLCTWWLKLLGMGSKSWMYGQIAHPWIIGLASIICCVTLAYVLHMKTRKQILVALGLGSACMAAVFAIPLTNPTSTLSNSSGDLLVCQLERNCVTIDDNGYFAGIKNAPKGIVFDVKRSIVQQHGTITISKCIVRKLSIQSLKALDELITSCDVKALHIPRYPEKESNKVKHLYIKLRQRCRDEGIQLHYITGSSL